MRLVRTNGWRRWPAFVGLLVGCLILNGSYIEKVAVGTSTYGELYASNNGAATGIALVNTWYQFTDFTAVGRANNTTPSTATDDITILSAGDYVVTVSVSFSGAVNDVYELQVQKNNGTAVYAGLLAERKLDAAGDIGVIEISGIADLAATDTVELWIRNTTGGADATLKQVNLTIHIAILGAGGGGGGGSTITAGTFAALPACSSSGDMYLFNNTGYEQAWCDGSNWHYYRDGFEMFPPVLGSFAWVNQGASTAIATYGGIYMTGPAIAGENHRLLVKAQPATPYTIDITMLPGFSQNGTPAVCAIWRESGTQEIIGLCATFQNGNWLKVFRWNNPTSFNGTYMTYMQSAVNVGKVILRIEDDGTNRKCYYSVQGGAWILLHSVSNTDFLTADQVGFSMNAGQPTWGPQTHFLSWNEQ